MPSPRLRRTLLGLLPSHLLTRIAGALADIAWPAWLLRLFLQFYVRSYTVDLTESAVPLSGFQTFTEFFTRPLRAEARPSDPDPTVCVSPVDGQVGVSGPIETNTLIQAKGHPYPLHELIPEPALAKHFEGGTFLTLYLSPRHYHRVHSPVFGSVQSLLYLPGTLFPVNPPTTRCVPRLFARNERLLTLLESSAWGQVAILRFGALIVGRIRVAYLAPTGGFRTSGRMIRRYENGPILERGDELGRFELGSTVILLWEPGRARLDLPPEGSEVRLGDRIALPTFPASHERL